MSVYPYWIDHRSSSGPSRIMPTALNETHDPAPLPYLDDAEDHAHGGLAITLEAELRQKGEFDMLHAALKRVDAQRLFANREG